LAALFTSDHRFGNRRARTVYRQPEMNEAMIGRWNGAVHPDDEVWHLATLQRSNHVNAKSSCSMR
jgi:calcineurin-like phosphoesterase family protein